MKLDGATFLLQWATGGLAFLWVTTRRREVSLGYGWLLRGIFGVMAAGAAALFATQDLTAARSVALAGSIAVGTSLMFVPKFGLDLSANLDLFGAANDNRLNAAGGTNDYAGGAVLLIAIRALFELHR